MKLTDHELVEKCLKSNKRAQRLLFDRFYPKVFRVARRYNENIHDCEDIVLNVFNRVFLKLSSLVLNEKDSLEKWIHRISINESLRAYKRKMPVSFRENFDNLELSHYDSSDFEIDDLASQDISMSKLKQAIAQMPKGYRVIFQLKVLDGLTHPEISEYLNISINTSKSQMLKAKKHLRAKIKINEGRI